MIDFLRANTWCSQDEYKWGMTVPQVRLAGMDFKRVEYLPDKPQKPNHGNDATVIDSEENLKNLNDLGIPII